MSVVLRGWVRRALVIGVLWGAVADMAAARAVVIPTTAHPNPALVSDVASHNPIDPKVSDQCGDLLPGHAARRLPHDAAVGDLLALRDFGAQTVSPGAAPGFALSPDRRHLAVQLRQADPEHNDYCQGLAVFDLATPDGTPRMLDVGGDFVREHFNMYGLSDFPSGVAAALTPSWSPDGRWIAFLRRDRDLTRLYVVSASGGPVRQVGGGAADVVSFHWGQDGTGLDFAENDMLVAAAAVQDKEGASGYHYDDRFWSLASMTPFLRGDHPPTRYRVRISTDGAISDPTASGSAWEEGGDRAERIIPKILPDNEKPGAYLTRLHARVGHADVACHDASCTDVGGAWFISSLDAIAFARWEGFARTTAAVYLWKPGTPPRRIWQSRDALIGCEVSGDELLCGRERSAVPRDVVAINLGTGRLRQVVDVNPEWASVQLGAISRILWKNRFGLEAAGDLVLPPHPRPGTRLPLVVVQYDTRGFLRGGTGDEYPIEAIAAAGYAVLSISRPMDYAIARAREGITIDRQRVQNEWTDRANAHDALLRGVALAKKSAPIDSHHLAITGLSDGASTATYALAHSHLFSLALLSTCCEDPMVSTTQIGPTYDAMLRENHYPLPWEEHRMSWRRISLAMNADHVCARVQIQAADREARFALTSYSELRRHGVPTDMYVFPDEYHIKWQPAHRAAIYRRNIDTIRDWASRPPARCRSR